MSQDGETALICITCKQPILVTDEWSWLDAKQRGHHRQPEHDKCFNDRFARAFPRATKVEVADV
jgi:hypothetical protein